MRLIEQPKFTCPVCGRAVWARKLLEAMRLEISRVFAGGRYGFPTAQRKPPDEADRTELEQVLVPLSKRLREALVLVDVAIARVKLRLRAEKEAAR